MWPKNTIHRQHTERGQLLCQLLELNFHIRFELYFHIRFRACFACLSSEGFNNPFFSVFVVAFQRPSVNETELNNDLRLSAVMIVCILV